MENGSQRPAVWNWLCAVSLAGFYFATSVYIAHKRLFWYDELATLEVVKMPDLSTVWRHQIGFLADSAPIAYHVLARLAYSVSGHNELSTRILSALALFLSLLVVFDCARRLTDGAHGLIALCVVGSSFIPFYGYEGRPYTLAFLFMAIALWLWLHTDPNSKPAALAFGLAVFLSLMMHYNMILMLVPFGLWELNRWRPWQRPSWKLMTSLLGMAGVFAVSLPQMNQNALLVSVSWCPPSTRALVQVYVDLFPDALFVLAAFGILLCLWRGVARPMSDAEQLCWLFLTVPFAGYLLAEAVTYSFYNRYMMAILPGVAVGFACLVSRYLSKPAAIALLLIVAAISANRQLLAARHPETINPLSTPYTQEDTRELLAAEEAILADGRTAVITDSLPLAALRYYSRRPDFYVMYAPDTIPFMCEWYGSACWDKERATVQSTRVAALKPSDLLFKDMRNAGFRPTVKMTSPLVIYFTRP